MVGIVGEKENLYVVLLYCIRAFVYVIGLFEKEIFFLFNRDVNELIRAKF